MYLRCAGKGITVPLNMEVTNPNVQTYNTDTRMLMYTDTEWSGIISG